MSAEESIHSTSDLRTYFRLLTYLKKWLFFFALSILGFVIYAGSQTGLAHLMKYFVDGFQANSGDYLLLVPLGLIGIAFVRGVGFFIGNYFIAKVSMNIVHEIRCEIFNYFMVAPKSYHDRNNVGELMSIIIFNVSLVSGAATDAIKIIVREGLTIIGLIVYLFWMNWQLSSVFLLVAPVIAVGVYLVGKKLKELSRKMQSSMGSITHVTKESLSSLNAVRSFGGQAHESWRFETSSKDTTKLLLKLARLTTANSPVMQFIISIALAGLMFAVMKFFQDQSAGDVIAYITAAGLVPKPLRQLTDIWGMLQRGIVAAESIFETLDGDVEKNDGTIEAKNIKGDIKFTNLSFTYEQGNTPALDNINLDVNAGEMVALVGHSGSGKTTITNLLLRFYDYEEGSITLDGVELKDYELFGLRKQFSLVTQEIELFNETVRHNIAYGMNELPPDEDIWKALESANASEFVNQLDKKLDTFIGENGSNLSGGQRQRLAIARAILKNAPVLILDEATSALDSSSERLIQEALDTVTENRTTFVIAHRLSTILKADKIFVFNDGRLVETGTHEELAALNGPYSVLYKTQFESK